MDNVPGMREAINEMPAVLLGAGEDKIWTYPGWTAFDYAQVRPRVLASQACGFLPQTRRGLRVLVHPAALCALTARPRSEQDEGHDSTAEMLRPWTNEY